MDRKAFERRWSRLRADETVITRVIVADDEVAGTIGSWGDPEGREVTYWIGRSYWGKGIATCALNAFLTVDPSRPLHARVACDNVASHRVLEKCGFRSSRLNEASPRHVQAKSRNSYCVLRIPVPLDVMRRVGGAKRSGVQANVGNAQRGEPLLVSVVVRGGAVVREEGVEPKTVSCGARRTLDLLGGNQDEQQLLRGAALKNRWRPAPSVRGCGIAPSTCGRRQTARDRMPSAADRLGTRGRHAHVRGDEGSRWGGHTDAKTRGISGSVDTRLIAASRMGSSTLCRSRCGLMTRPGRPRLRGCGPTSMAASR